MFGRIQKQLAGSMTRYEAMMAEANRLRQSGEMAPLPSDRNQAKLMSICSWFIKQFIGEVTVIGAENLSGLESPSLTVGNHGHILDVAVIYHLVNRKMRHPAAEGPMSLCGGLTGLWASQWGIFAVDVGNGARARESMIRVLSNGDDMFLFPSAITSLNGVEPEWKTGAVRITRAASETRGKPVRIVPVYIRYGRYPGSWISSLNLWIQWLIMFPYAYFFHKGVTVVVGKPIDPVLELDPDHHLATAQLKQIVLDLDPSGSDN